MIKLKQTVIHDGKTFEKGDTIEKIEQDQADRLVKLGAAFLIGEEVNDETADEPDNSQAAVELDEIDYNDLKSLASDLDVDFKGNISKAKLIQLIIDDGKADDVLSVTEVED